MSDGTPTAIFHGSLHALFDEGNSCFRAGDLQGAAARYRRALEIEPCFPEASFNLGCAVDLLAGPAEAIAHFSQAVKLRPEWCEARGKLGHALARVGRMAEAVAELEAAAQLRPEDPGIRNNLGLALGELGRAEEACSSFHEAIRLNPHYPEAHNNLAILFERYGRTSDAIDSCLEALKLRPDYPEAHHNLATALKSQGRHREALAHFREALRLRPGYLEARSALLFTLCYPADLREQEVVAEHLAFGELQRVTPPAHDNDRSPDRMLRLGYVSADFRSHAVARFIEPVLRHHDRCRFQVVLYSNVAVPDRTSLALEKLADRFVNVAGMPDHTAAELIRRDRIDILVDLSGHSAGNRLALFAAKPAPLQATWLGYPHTTGLSSVDYRITDAVTDPPGAEPFYAEKLCRLPRLFCCFAPPPEAPELNPPPSLSSGIITFGSFNNPSKIAPDTVALWAGVLLLLPGSRMLVKGYSLADGGSRARLISLFREHGIAEERLELSGNLPSYRDHLSLYHRVDIALDTFPYHGATTTCEALWMGVPVVTLAGKTHRSRVGAALLGSIGLEELVAQREEEYLEAALSLARDPARLATLRMTLRGRVAASPLTDAAGFTRELEEALREMWRSWADGSRAFVDHEAVGRAYLQAGRRDDALRQFLAAARSGSATGSLLGGIRETLNRQMAADLTRGVERDEAALGALQHPAAGQDVADGTAEETAEFLLAAGLVTPAELLCRYLEDRGRRTPALSRILAGVALSVGAPAHAVRHLREALERGDANISSRILLVKAEGLEQLQPAPRPERFLLIKAWGYGFWSDVSHLLGQCLLAEITGRIPVVQWGGNSLFSDALSANAFEAFFEPLSGYGVEELAARCRSFYPPKWSSVNLPMAAVDQREGGGSCCSSLYTLGRAEEVVVSDFHYNVNDLIPWIPPGHPLYGLCADDLFLYLFRRYLRIKPWIAAKAEAFYRQKMAGRLHLALHVRGGDKGGEDPNLSRLNRLYHPEIERYLLHTPDAALFLITDDSEILANYLERYRDRLIHTGATRTGTGEGVHYQSHPSRYRLGEEVLVDALLAARCESFIGNGLSNVSCAVAQMKAWPPGQLRLLGARLDRLRQFTLYRN